MPRRATGTRADVLLDGEKGDDNLSFSRWLQQYAAWTLQRVFVSDIDVNVSCIAYRVSSHRHQHRWRDARERRRNHAGSRDDERGEG